LPPPPPTLPDELIARLPDEYNRIQLLNVRTKKFIDPEQQWRNQVSKDDVLVLIGASDDELVAQYSYLVLDNESFPENLAGADLPGHDYKYAEIAERLPQSEKKNTHVSGEPTSGVSPMVRHPAAFLSYARFDDRHEKGRITRFRERLSGEVRMQLGGEFEIFQDHTDIAWGEPWKQRIDQSLDAVTFLDTDLL
jgi:hypothetical protein